MYNSQDISVRIKALAKSRGVQLKTMLAACNLGVNTLANMNNGRMPLSDCVARIADYLDCSVDYLLGRAEHTKKENAPATSESERLVSIYGTLGDFERGRLLGYAEALAATASSAGGSNEAI